MQPGVIATALLEFLIVPEPRFDLTGYGDTGSPPPAGPDRARKP